MKHLSLAIWLALGAAAPFAQAQTPPLATVASPIMVSHVWARPTPVSVHTGAVYFTLSTTGSPDHLVGVSTPIAASAEVHETIKDGDVMKMRPVAGGIPIEPGKPVTLSPGGYHIMLMGVKQPLAVGMSFPLTLTFEHTPAITTKVTVETPGGSAAAMPGMPMMSH